MSGKLKTAGKVAGAATVVVPTLRKLIRDVEDFDVNRYVPVSTEHMRQSRRRYLIAGSIIGIAAGFVAGVLLAPRLREKMKIDEFAGEARERVSGTAHEFQQKATDTVHEAREKVEERMQDVRERVEDSMQTAQEKVQSGMETVQHRTEAGMQTAQEKAEAGMQSAESRVTEMPIGAGDVRQPAAYDTTTDWTAERAVPYFRGVHYPAGKHEIRAIAAAHGAPEDLLDRVDELSEQTFRHVDDITMALGIGTYQPLTEETPGASDAA